MSARVRTLVMDRDVRRSLLTVAYGIVIGVAIMAGLVILDLLTG